jgi:hypothetical protein
MNERHVERDKILFSVAYMIYLKNLKSKSFSTRLECPLPQLGAY